MKKGFDEEIDITDIKICTLFGALIDVGLSRKCCIMWRYQRKGVVTCFR